jgi:hypothetical protein
VETDPKQEAWLMTGILTGWLLGALMSRGGDCMKIAGTEAAPPAAFVVTFASGLRLRVAVSEEPPP